MQECGISLSRIQSYVLTPEYRLQVPLAPQAVIRSIQQGEEALVQEVWPVKDSDIKARLNRGDLCYIGLLKGKVAHFSWVQREGTHVVTEAGRRFRILNGDIWIYHCRTADFAKGFGLYPSTLAAIAAEHFSNGSRRIWIYTSSGNIASQRGVTKAGFRYAGTLKALRLGRLYVPLGPVPVALQSPSEPEASDQASWRQPPDSSSRS